MQVRTIGMRVSSDCIDKYRANLSPHQSAFLAISRVLRGMDKHHFALGCYAPLCCAAAGRLRQCFDSKRRADSACKLLIYIVFRRLIWPSRTTVTRKSKRKPLERPGKMPSNHAVRGRPTCRLSPDLRNPSRERGVVAHGWKWNSRFFRDVQRARVDRGVEIVSGTLDGINFARALAHV